MAEYAWPPAGKRGLIGQSISRLDGPAKASGRVKYTYDVKLPEMLSGKMVISPYAHAKVLSIDTSEAEGMPGVKAVQLMKEPGQEVLWAGQEVVALAAETEDQAIDAARKVKIQYEPLPHLVKDAEPEAAGANKRQLAEQVDGNPATGFGQAEVIHEGTYGSAVINHCCLEAHGQVAHWEGESLIVHASTQ